MNLDWPPTSALDSSDATYAGYAEIYDVLYDQLNEETAFYLQQAADTLGPDGKILEIGSGTGRLARHLLAAGYTVVGVEPSKEMLAKAVPRLARFGDRYQPHHSDIARVELDERFRLIVAPWGMVAHLLTDDDRMYAYTRAYELLEHGGAFIFDDMPDWLGASSDSRLLMERARAVDPATGLTVRLQANTIDIAEQPLSVRYDVVDWLADDDRIARRLIIRVVFRNISLVQEIDLLKRAGFNVIELFGSFDGAPFDTADLAQNKRLIVKCWKE